MLETPPLTIRARDVSPLGASRFERPYSPPRSYRGTNSRSNQTSATTSPTTPPTSSHKTRSYVQHCRSYTNQTAADSIFSTDTMDTAPTSISSVPHKDSIESPTSPVCVVSPDDWFARFHSNEDLSAQTDECPDRATLAAVQNIPLYDSSGNSRPFGSLYDPSTATHQRQLLLFVRHFYCGACQAYLKSLTESISMQEYFTIPIPTSIIIIGCGQPDMIQHYKTFTGCPFPMFADPSRELFKKLGMNVSMNIGRERPEYMKDISPAAWAAGQVKTIQKSLKDPDGIRKRDIIRGGNPMQIGGEFLCEDGQVIWCHRMKNYRNHTEIKVLRKLLELDE